VVEGMVVDAGEGTGYSAVVCTESIRLVRKKEKKK
jgi:hypothetical protein